jgi:hypothetical protein
MTMTMVHVYLLSRKQFNMYNVASPVGEVQLILMYWKILVLSIKQVYMT